MIWKVVGGKAFVARVVEVKDVVVNIIKFLNRMWLISFSTTALEQNKNRMVLPILFFMAKLKVCRTACTIFLIKRHTKNDCDHMIHLFKYIYRKVKFYSHDELIALINQHSQVNAVAYKPRDSKDWDALENVLVDKAEGILKNLIFIVHFRESNTTMI